MAALQLSKKFGYLNWMKWMFTKADYDKAKAEIRAQRWALIRAAINESPPIGFACVAITAWGIAFAVGLLPDDKAVVLLLAFLTAHLASCVLAAHTFMVEWHFLKRHPGYCEDKYGIKLGPQRMTHYEFDD